MSNFKRVANNFVYSAIYQIAAICLGLIVPRLAMVGYGSEVSGLLNSVTQLIIYLGLFESGVQAVAMQSLYKPVKINDRDKINAILSAVNKSYKKTGLCYFCGLVFLSVVYPFCIKDNTLSFATVFGVLFFSGIPNVVLFLFQGKYKILLLTEGKNYVISNLCTIITIATNIVKIVLLSLGFNVVLIVVIAFLISLSQAVYIVVLFKTKYKWVNLSVKPDYSALKQRNFAFIHQISDMIFNHTDTLILTIFCGLKVVSVYTVYKLVVSHVDSFVNIPFNSFSFALGQQYNTDKQKYIKMFDVVQVFYGAITFAVYTVVYCLMEPFVALYTKGVTDINYVDKNLVILFVAISLLTLARLPSLSTINYARHFKKTLPQTLIETGINLTVSLTLVTKYEIYGVLCGTVVALLYRTTDVIIYTNRKLLNRSAWKSFFVYGVNSVLIVLFIFVYRSISIVINSYFAFLVVGFILTIVSVIVFLTVASFIFQKESSIAWDIFKTKVLKKH